MVGAEIQQKEIIMSTKPAHKIRNGVLQVTIWRNQSEKGNIAVLLGGSSDGWGGFVKIA